LDQIGRYRVIRPLAQGGMGQVFLAEDPSLERQIAIKLLHKDPNRGLRHEAKTLAALSHPNIVTIFEIGEHAGQDFIAMEYLSGHTLRDILSGTPPTREELLAIVSSVAVAVAAAHKGGILHRDIKPENVVATPNGVKVVDFGIARRLEERASNVSSPADLYEVLVTPGPDAATRRFERNSVAGAGTQTVFGTPAYMAPEVLGGEPSSAASDVYSLGVLLHECLAGKRPYDAGNMIETIAHIIQAPPPTLADPLNPLLTRMLAREPADRPSLSQVIAALQPGAPVVKKKRPWVALGLVGLLAIAGVTIAVLATRTSEPEVNPFKQAPVPVVEAKVLIAPVVVDMTTWGLNRAESDEVAKVLVRALGNAEGAKLEVGMVAGRVLGAQLQAAREQRAHYLIVMKIDEDKMKPELTGTVSVYSVDSGKPVDKEPRRSRGPSTQLAQLQYDLLDAALMTIAPNAKLPRTADRARAQGHVTDGRAQVTAGNFDKARSDFDAAVNADPSYPDAWYGLALTLGWTEAPEELTLQAAERAAELATGQRKELMQGVSLFFKEHFTESRLALEKLEKAGVADGPDGLELLYFLGEANWHDGRHDAGYAYFKRALAIPPRSRAMAIHPAIYLVARRQGEEARYLAGVAGLSDTMQIDFADGRYRKLADGTQPAYRMTAKIVLGEKLTEVELGAVYSHPIELATIKIAFALEERDQQQARELLARVWADHVADRRLTPRDYYHLEYLGEVLLAADLVEEARRLVLLLAETSKQRPKRGYHRFAMLAAALAKDASLIPSGPTVSERNRMLAEMAHAQIAGDRAKAIQILAAAVANPSPTWEYAERAALIRLLRAANKKREAEAVCKDTLAPAVYRHALPVVRGLCRR
jgi:predicted Ser/Thr protein kinase/tetratricopeptide (TPR) repeat protein